MSHARPADGRGELNGVDDTLRLLLRDLAKESAKPTIRRARLGQRNAIKDGTVSSMQQSIGPRILVALSIVYGATIPVLAILGSDHVGQFAAVGGIVVGVCWALYSILKPKPSDPS